MPKTIWASRAVLSGAISLGLRTTVHPAAIAGPILLAIWYSG